jgi:predicted dinucleotide-binding enzyme
LPDAVVGADVVLLAVPWAAVDDVLSGVGAGAGGLLAKTVIDPTNPVEHGRGRHLLDTGSAAEHIASRAPGAHVVKAFNVHPAAHWEHARPGDVVTIAGDDPTALDVVRGLVRDVGATPHTLGGLGRARQIEELAATVIALAFGGINPRSAVPEA